MTPLAFPPLCPFGDSEDDGVTVHRPSSVAILWAVAEDHFLRVNVYENGDVTYLLGTREQVEDDLLASIDPYTAAVSEVDLARLRSFRLTRIIGAVTL